MNTDLLFLWIAISEIATLMVCASVVPSAGSDRSHGHDTNKQIVQSDICHARNRNKIHRAFGISEPAEDRADDIIGCNKRNPDKADEQILYCSLHRFLWRTDQRDNRL